MNCPVVGSYNNSDDKNDNNFWYNKIVVVVEGLSGDSRIEADNLLYIFI